MANQVRDDIVTQIQSVLGMNAGYVVDVYERFKTHPSMVAPEWRRYFEGLARGEVKVEDLPGSAQNGVPGGGEPVSETGVKTPVDSGTRPDPVPQVQPTALDPDEQLVPLRGGPARIVENMEASRAVPTASSYRTFPVKLLEENRKLINEQLKLSQRGKVSFTHLIAWAVVQAAKKFPVINDAYRDIDGVPHRIHHPKINLGVAVDMQKRDGSRTLLVPNIKGAEAMTFAEFWDAYNDVIARSRAGKIVPEDFQGTTLSLTNPGTVGTTMSVPRLMEGQGAIVATGAIDYPAENRAMSPRVLNDLGISRRMTASCTYDHRIIQGAESGMFLKEVEELLRGSEDFYDIVFQDLAIPLSACTLGSRPQS